MKLSYVIIAVLIVALLFSLNTKKEVVKEVVITDTVTSVNLDTVFVEKPIFIKEIIVDTFLIRNAENDEYIISKTQRYYKDSTYEAWVSGYRPNLDSINVFRKTITNTITNTVTREIYPKTTDLYFNVGVDCINDKFSPNLGLGVKFKNDILINGSIGVYEKSILYGVKIGYKIK